MNNLARCVPPLEAAIVWKNAEGERGVIRITNKIMSASFSFLENAMTIRAE
jgi:hypothetical protein